jgi:hypothetical protein
MTDIHEQRINIKFCFKVGKIFTETYEMMENFYGDQYMNVMNGLRDLRMIVIQHMMSRVWDDPQRRVTMLMLRKFVKSYVLIVLLQRGK